MNVAEPLGCDDAGADEFLDLTVLLAELRRDYGVAASYSRLWGALVDGRIPGVRDGNRWKVASRDKPLAARVLSYRPGPGGARRNIANAA
jgi:hypothetical protein